LPRAIQRRGNRREVSMYTIMWTFQVPAGTGKADLTNTIKATAHNYQNVPGLIRKYYGIAPDGKSLVGIYLWDSKAAADKLYTPEWIATVTKRWGAPPARAEWDTPMVVDNSSGQLIAAE